MSKKKILLVEGNGLLRGTYTRILEERGYKVESLFNSRTALQISRTRDFDLLILDNEMPDMTGAEFLAHLRKKDKNTKVIMLTFNPTDEAYLDCMSLGVNDYVSKNNGMSAMIKAIESALFTSAKDRPPAGSESRDDGSQFTVI